jgi:hypothetical protein
MRITINIALLVSVFCYLCLAGLAALKKQERTIVVSWIAQIQGGWMSGLIASGGSEHG